jgi:hypothetical protein
MTFWCVALALCVYFGFRNFRVWKFRDKLIDRVFQGPYWMEKREILDRVSYNEMMLSFKRLKLKSYFTEEEIEILNS